ncbi:MAG: hypothetical protein ACPHL6_00265 [Rubripirellula sp.]
MSNYRSLMDDGNARLHRAFVDFSKIWRASGDFWRDDRRRQFEEKHLSSVAPILQRLSSTLSELSDSIGEAEKELNDEI